MTDRHGRPEGRDQRVGRGGGGYQPLGEPLSTVRPIALGFAIITVALQAALVDPGKPLAAVVSGYVALAGILAAFCLAYHRRSRPAGDWLLAGLAVAVVAGALREPLAVVTLCLAIIVNQSLYGTNRAALASFAALLVALPIGLAGHDELDPAGADPDRWLSLIGLVPALALAAAVVRALQVVFNRQDRLTRLTRILATASRQLIEETDPARIRAVVRSGMAELCQIPPGFALLTLRRTEDLLLVCDHLGISEVAEGVALPLTGEPARGSTEPARGSTEPARGSTGKDSPEPPIRWAPSHAQQLNDLSGEQRQWLAIEPPERFDADLLVLGGSGAIPDELVNGVSDLAREQVLAEHRATNYLELEYLAHHDQLTGLDNRTLFLSRLERASEDGQLGAVLIVDLDSFRQVNDAYGHQTGDAILVGTARTLRQVAGERAIIARLGGDQFGIGIGPGMNCDRLAERIRQLLRDPTVIQHPTGACVGIAVADFRLGACDLVRRADTAAFAAKSMGKSQIEHFNPDRHGNVAELRMIEQHLPSAARRGEIIVHYQPHVDLRTRRCVGVEALARWMHPTLGMVPPARFIPLAERTGQIAGIGAEVLRVACRQATEWSTLPGGENLQIAVNVAAPQLYDSMFVDLVAEILARSGLPARRLTLELTESGTVDNERALEQVNAIADLGVRISLDDFGTGYASLSTLYAIAAHQVKIDRSFVSGKDRRRGQRMVQLIVASGRILDLEVVAEGVETEQQVDELLRDGVSLAQGYLFAKPMPAEEFAGWLEANIAAGYGGAEPATPIGFGTSRVRG